MRLVLISSITGQRIRTCIEQLVKPGTDAYCAKSDEGHPIVLEDQLVIAADSHLRKYRKAPSSGYSLSDVLRLPQAELEHSCHHALEISLQLLSAAATDANAVGLLAFHPVLHHQLTRDFVHPYQSEALARIASEKGFQLETIVSIHDDVFDVYRTLLVPQRLFAPLSTRKQKHKKNAEPYYPREPLRDIHEQLLLLGWRCRELSEAKALASGAGARHFLFHQKGNLRALVRVICERAPSVYFSHPISQPRRDITGKRGDPSKCKTPDPERGHNMIKACQEVAGKLLEHFALVEPTAIDEWRIDLNWLKNKTDKELARHVLPPLIERWPLGDGPHLGGALSGDLFPVPLLPAEENVFAQVKAEGEALSGYASALELLSEEILRQINVRDHTLAEQCDFGVAYRPFSLPDSPAPTGGVNEEIAVVMNKVALGKITFKPALFIIHPYEDEKERRGKEFDNQWKDIVDKHFAANPSGRLKTFRDSLRSSLVNAPYQPDSQKVASEVDKLIVKNKIALRPVQDNSSMPSGDFSRAEDSKKELVEYLITGTAILKSALQRASEKGDQVGFVVFVDSEKVTTDLIDAIKNAQHIIR
jgi:hypothetical protein